jgi:hypothetical protein
VTLEERLTAAQARSVTLYLDRQALEASRQQLVLRAQETDFALLRLDGEIELLQALIAEPK